MGSLLVMVQCNDYRNGMHQGWTENVVVEDEIIELYGPRIRTRFDYKKNRLHLGRRAFACRGMREWVGNWCWDGFTVTPAVAADMVNYLREQGYEWEQIATSLEEKFATRDHEFTADDLLAAICTPTPKART
jgi:hypothetical protein